MTTTSHAEVERTFDVDVGTELPDLVGHGGVASAGDPVVHELEAVYFDTAGLDLIRRGATLRRRTGGDDAGWHLKLRRSEDERTEVQLPLGRAKVTPPKPLRTRVLPLSRTRGLRPVARVATRRVVRDLLAGDGTVLAELCDDTVTAQRLDPSGEPEETTDWREVEVELVDGDRAVLDAVGTAVLAAGARPARTSSKLARALGEALPRPEPVPSPADLDDPTIEQALRAHLATHVAALHAQDARVREDDAEGVHKMRIAARRLRGALTTYRPVLEPGTTEDLREELRWLGRSLGTARDAQVLREHLDGLLATQPEDLVEGPVAQRLDAELDEAARQGRADAREVLTGERYLALLDALDELVADLPVTAEGRAPAREVLPRLVQRDAKRLRRAERAVAGAGAVRERDLALHEVRKKAKRLRYGAESAAPVLGKRAARVGRRAKAVQQALGRHQDAVVARGLLRDVGERAHAAGDSAFTFGRLHALEEWRAARAEQDYERARRRLRLRKVRRRLGG